ncbi:isoflavone reductase family protein [Mollisia scopiformis]|uniref:Isoflavone reductase family protein n=1 Tax=Mollisia scopiformis TaxID=149040 RepID=A0A132B4X5_MOLSC|nr:isoflavone reductase family protein [Mollisia scopiformis]KUJ07293.1 isoflavone reductase family protein [Mollisia scopiformis]
MSSPIKNVMIIGASGSIGPAVISSLLANNFAVSVLTRESSSSTFPSDITVHCTDYSPTSLIKAFQGQDAIISAIATMSTSLQSSIVDAAVTAGVKRFIPSEYGIDTSIPEVETLVPLTKGKRDTIAHLRTKEKEGLSWTAICVGSFFDWTFALPRVQGWNLPERKALIFDGGIYEYEATNIEQIGRAVAAVLLPGHLEETENKYVYVNSFTVSQTQVLNALEKATGEKFEVEHAKVEELVRLKWEGLGLKGGWFGSEEITAALYGNGNVNNFSKKGLLNDRLGLPKEDLEETLKRVLEKKA